MEEIVNFAGSRSCGSPSYWLVVRGIYQTYGGACESLHCLALECSHLTQCSWLFNVKICGLRTNCEQKRVWVKPGKCDRGHNRGWIAVFFSEYDWRMFTIHQKRIHCSCVLRISFSWYMWAFVKVNPNFREFLHWWSIVWAYVGHEGDLHTYSNCRPYSFRICLVQFPSLTGCVGWSQSMHCWV